MVRQEVILAVGSCLIAVLIAGCEEQNLSTVKKSRLIAYENRQLKEQLAQQEKKIEDQLAQQKKEIKEQVAQREKQIEERNKLLEECQQRRKILEERFEGEVNTRINEKMAIFIQASEQMRQENDEFKAQVAELSAQVSKLEQQLKNIGSPTEPQSLAP
jgi:outer membrane murein-binding lipoprotein Lpp